MKQTRRFADSSSFVERQRAEISRLRLLSHRVPRDTLLRRLERLEPLTLLQSLPGTGKTTLLADWAIHRMEVGDAVIWVSATEALNSLESCGEAIADVVLGPVSANLSAADTPVRLVAERRECIGQICAEKPKRKVIVIIDNAENFTDSALRSWLFSLCRKHPNFYLVGSSDKVHPLSADALSTQLSINLISGQHLMIPRSHASAFASSWGHEIAQEEVDRLHAESGGWLLLLRTMLDTPTAFVGANAVYGMQRFREDHLRTKLNQQLVATAAPMALLDGVSARLMDDLYRDIPQLRQEAVGQTARESVQLLVDSGMLRPGDGAQAAETLHFPRAVRAYLAHLFEAEQPAALQALHAAAAAHYERAGRLEDIGLLLDHARRAENWELLNRTAGQQGWWLGVRHAAVAYEVFGDLPEAVRRHFPVLHMTHSLVHALPVATIEPDVRSPMVQRVLADAADPLLSDARPPGDPNEQAILTIAAISGRRQRGDFEGSRKLSDTFRNSVLRRYSTGLTALNSAMYYLQSGLTELTIGDLERAVRRFTRAYEESTSVEAQFVGVAAAGHNALIFAYEGRRTVARQWLERAEQGLTKVPWARSLIRVPSVLAAAQLAMDEYDAEQARQHLEAAGSLMDTSEVWAFNAHVQARFALLFGSPASTLSTIDHAVELRTASTPLSPLSEALVMRARCDLLIAEGELNRAERVITEGIGHDPSLLFEQECTLARRSLFVAYARLCQVSGNYAAARQAVSSSLSRRLTQRKTIELLLIDAGAAHQMGSPSDAARSFRRAITLSKRAGVHTALLTLDRSTRHALLDLFDGDRTLELPDSLQELIESPGVYPAHAQLVVLTERERSVLRELAGGASIPDIARTQVLSANTVKKQTVSLYRKLGTDNRTEAVRKAYELRLID